MTLEDLKGNSTTTAYRRHGYEVACGVRAPGRCDQRGAHLAAGCLRRCRAASLLKVMLQAKTDVNATTTATNATNGAPETQADAAKDGTAPLACKFMKCPADRPYCQVMCLF